MSEQTPTNRQNPMTNKQSVEELEEKLPYELVVIIDHHAPFLSEDAKHKIAQSILFKLQAYKQAIREETLTLGSSWPLLDVLEKLNEAAEILLKEKDYDGHGYEEITLASRRAEEILQQLKH